MTPRELPDTKTPVFVPDLASVLWHAWTALVGSPPVHAAIELLVAWWGLETGWGRSCHCFNLGNAKGVVGGSRCWTFFACNELINGKWVWFYPKNPGCCFRAFETLEAGAVDWLALIHDRFPEAFAALSTGDPTTLAHAARLRGYYTAPEADYTNILVGCLPHVRSFGIDWAALETAPNPPDLAPLIPLERDQAAELAERDQAVADG